MPPCLTEFNPGRVAQRSTATLIEAVKPGFSLPQAFYNDPDIFEWDMERVFGRNWVFAGHTSQIAKPFDYFLFTLGRNSIIIIRDDQDQVHALHNTCRHRGSLVCLKETGNAPVLVCPYHAWKYGADGRLISALAMDGGFRKEEHGLRRCQVRLVEGLIYICISESAPAIEEAWADWRTYLRANGTERARIAVRKTWMLEANWKLVVENFGECYHCGLAHPEYCSVMAHAIPDGFLSERRQAQYAAFKEAWTVRTAAMGHLAGRTPVRAGQAHVCERQPINEGFLTQSRDGQPVAPLMGDFKDYDGGYSSGRLWPTNYFLASCDHVVIPQFVPLAAQKTRVDMLWLVREDAREGVDYDPERLTWVWKVTTDQDGEIIENNQRGVNSDAYLPGPYSRAEESLVRFIRWYLDQLQDDKDAAQTELREVRSGSGE